MEFQNVCYTGLTLRDKDWALLEKQKIIKILKWIAYPSYLQAFLIDFPSLRA